MKMMRLVGIVFLVGLVLFACSGKESAPQEKKEDIVMIKEENKRRIYLAGGCFWGVEGYFQRIEGVGETSVGYANGLGEETSYRVAKTDHAETVEVVYDASRISLERFCSIFRIIDLFVNRRNDVGRQYRTGIYYVDETDLPLIEKVMEYEGNAGHSRGGGACPLYPGGGIIKLFGEKPERLLPYRFEFGSSFAK